MKRIRLWEGVGETGGEEGLGDGRRDAKEKEVERERERKEKGRGMKRGVSQAKTFQAWLTIKRILRSFRRKIIFSPREKHFATTTKFAAPFFLRPYRSKDHS